MLTNSRTELPNPHKKCVRELLNCLAVSDNEYQCISIELRDIQKELKQSIDNVIYQCSEKRKLACASEERLKEFQNNVQNIDTITEGFNKRIEDIKNKRQKILDESKDCFFQLNTAKIKFKEFHHKSINYLKTFAVQSNDPEVVKICEKDVNEINKQFADEVLYIKKCENVLRSFIQLLNICKSEKIESNLFDEYEWIPQGKSVATVDTIANDIRNNMGNTLRKAFAYLHILQPGNKERFLAQYLMAVERNEEIIKEKLERFTIK